MNLPKPTSAGLHDYGRWALQNNLKKIVDKLSLAEQDFLVKFD
jgi:hypothetical protein